VIAGAQARDEGPLPSIFLPQFSLSDVVRELDAMSDEARLATVLSLRRRHLAPLFEAAAANEPLRLTDLVPAAVPPLTEVIHEGKNSLPAFTRFQKRFCRPPAERDAGAELWGYNEQTFKTFTGPGYFVLHPDGNGELVVDYTRLPPDHPPAWPRILPNSSSLSIFVYHRMIDVLRRVSRDVIIGRAFRRGRPYDAWFALVRRPSA
jgi:hypothetical protein